MKIISCVYLHILSQLHIFLGLMAFGILLISGCYTSAETMFCTFWSHDLSICLNFLSFSDRHFPGHQSFQLHGIIVDFACCLLLVMTVCHYCLPRELIGDSPQCCSVDHFVFVTLRINSSSSIYVYFSQPSRA